MVTCIRGEFMYSKPHSMLAILRRFVLQSLLHLVYASALVSQFMRGSLWRRCPSRRANAILSPQPTAPPPRSQGRKTAASPMVIRLELSRSADASRHHRAQYHAPQRRKTRHRDLHPHDRGQPKTAASPRSGRRNRGVDTAARPFQSQAIEASAKLQFGCRNFGLIARRLSTSIFSA